MPSTALLSKIKPEIVEMIRSFDCTGDELAAKSRELTLMMLEESEYPFSRRQFTPGHITCKAGEHRLAGMEPVYWNSKYAVYRTAE